MRPLLLALTILSLSLIYLSAPALGDSTVTSAQTRVLAGEYEWRYQDDPGPLRAEFTATGEGTWDVAFYFRFNDRDRTYRGTAKGDLEGGRVEGEVSTDDRRRTFVFEGEIDAGRLEGTHAETTSGEASRTGTLTLTEVGESS